MADKATRFSNLRSKLRPRRWFRRSKSAATARSTKLPPVWSLLKSSGRLLRQLWRQVLGLVVIHAVTTYLFQAQSQNQSFSVLTFVGIVLAMTYVWLARQTIQERPELALKKALYRGPAQIVPLLLLLLLLGLQALPFSIGGFIFQIGVNSSPPIAIFYWEKLLFALGWLLLSIPTLYWLLPTLFGLIVVCLPGVGPLEARRATQGLVAGRMFHVWLKLLWLVVAYSLVLGGAVVGLVNLWPLATVYVLDYSGVVVLPLVICQLFTVYQAMRVTSGE